MNFEKLIVGKQTVDTEQQKRKIILGGYLILMYVGVDLFFFIANLFNPGGEPITLFIGFFIAGVCLILIRQGHINFAILLHLIRTNSLAFYFSMIDIDPYQTGTYIYFIPSSLGALAVFGYQERWKGLGFTALSAVLFLIAMFNPGEFSPDQAHFYLIVNFLLILIIGMLIIIFFDRLTLESEEKVIRKNKELIKANRELDRFVYSVSHDLRAPLSSILGLVDIYKLSTEAEDKSKIVGLIRGRVEKLDTFIREILDYSRNARLLVKQNQVPIELLIKSVIEDLQFLNGFDRIRIETQIQNDCHVKTDPERLKVILNNLLTNAIRYYDRSKNDPFIIIGVEKDETRWNLYVRDNGLGIKSELQARVFEMFFRASENSDGSGLGLYIVQETVQTLNGKILLDSAYGQGTSITITFPNE